MRILHVGNPAGVASVLSREQRRLGHLSDVLVYLRHPFGYEEDIIYSQKRLPIPILRYLHSFLCDLHLTMKRSRNYDIFHFHDVHTHISFPIALFRFLSSEKFFKRAIYHFHGSSLRKPHLRALVKNFNRNLDHIYVSTPDLLQYADNALWIPNPIDLEKWKPQERPQSETVRILHYSTPLYSYIHGVSYTEKAIQRLITEGYSIEEVKAINIPHDRMPDLIASCDIVIDRVAKIMGWYGVFACEALAMGKPVLAYINPQYERFMPFNPFVKTSPKTIYNDLLTLIEDPITLRKLGRQSRKYVEQVHDSKKIAMRWLKIYKSLR